MLRNSVLFPPINSFSLTLAFLVMFAEKLNRSLRYVTTLSLPILPKHPGHSLGERFSVTIKYLWYVQHFAMQSEKTTIITIFINWKETLQTEKLWQTCKKLMKMHLKDECCSPLVFFHKNIEDRNPEEIRPRHISLCRSYKLRWTGLCCA